MAVKEAEIMSERLQAINDPSIPPTKDAKVFSLIEQNRWIAYASPLVVAVVMILLKWNGGEAVRATIDFLTGPGR